MILYEVNLHIEKDIAEAYVQWLILQMQLILQCEGFRKARCFSELQDDATHCLITVHYEIETQADLNHYLQYYAPRMREDGIQRFDEHFSATRRLLTLQPHL